MDFGGTPRAGAVLDRVSAPRAGTSPRPGGGSRASATGSSSPTQAVGAVITTTSESTSFTPLADQLLRSDRAS